MRGPRPKPTRLENLEGRPGHRPVNDAEPDVPLTAATTDAPPAELQDDPVALEQWRYLCPLLAQTRLITDADRNALIALCLTQSVYLEACQKQRPLIQQAPSGYPIKNPYVTIAQQSLVALDKLWSHFGLTPSARSRVRVSERVPPLRPDAEDFDEFDHDHRDRQH